MVELKVGGVYKARNGERVEIVENDYDCTYPFDGKDGRSYMPNGREYKSRETENDLIAEWEDEPEVGKWIGWNGGPCPVHPETVVEVMSWAGCKSKVSAKCIRYWNDSDAQSQPIAYRIIIPYVAPPKPREIKMNGVLFREVLPDE